MLGKGQYDRKYLSCSCERTSVGPSQTGIRNEKKFTLTSHHEIGTSKVSETGGADATPVRAVRAITKWRAFSSVDRQRGSYYLRNEVDSHLSLGSFDGRVSLARWDGIALAEELEVVDERFHAFLHRGTRWRHELVVVNTHGTLSDLVQTLKGFPC